MIFLLRKMKRGKELFWYCLFLLAGFVPSLLLMLGIKFPDPSEVLLQLAGKLGL